MKNYPELIALWACPRGLFLVLIDVARPRLPFAIHPWPGGPVYIVVLGKHKPVREAVCKTGSYLGSASRFLTGVPALTYLNG